MDTISSNFRIDKEDQMLFDWRNKYTFTQNIPINTTGCKHSYIFAGVTAIETALLLKQKLSTQQFIDCNEDVCENNIVKFIQYYLNHPICLEKNYPYRGKAGVCMEKKCGEVVDLKNYTWVNQELINEQGIEKKLLWGPVLARMNLNKINSLYKTGIFNRTPECYGNPDQYALIVGMGISKTKPFWVVRNFLGPDWGEDGYFRISKDIGICGIGKESYVIYLDQTPSYQTFIVAVLFIIFIICAVCGVILTCLGLLGYHVMRSEHQPDDTPLPEEKPDDANESLISPNRPEYQDHYDYLQPLPDMKNAPTYESTINP